MMYLYYRHFNYFTTFLLVLGTVLYAPAPVQAQQNPLSKHEFRGAWIATVVNLDWPAYPGGSSAVQQRNLTEMIDGLKKAGINAVFFQVRTESDALYASDIEPWSYWLTGEQGAAPEPFYDPLEIAIEEAHKRGMELHAWFNPYRADRGSSYPKADDHVTITHPEWTLRFGRLQLLNPGLPEVRNYVTRVVMDVVGRYNIDGVHFDDYFYPYPPNQITTQDHQTFTDYSRGFTSIADWRRDNVNLLIAQIADSIRAVKPHITFGISPFGIWKNGVPAGITGMDAHSVIFADPLAWVEAQSIDYLVPQLYWPFGGRQDYAKLARWWGEKVFERHLYIGHGLYRADRATFSGTLFSANEVPDQVLFNRDFFIPGSVFFRASNITKHSSGGFADRLMSDLYRYEALTPSMSWKDMSAPQAPTNLRHEWSEGEDVTLFWDSPTSTADDTTDARFYAVYRVLANWPPDPEEASQEGKNLLAVTGELSLTDAPGIASDSYHYFVRAVSSNSVESVASNIITLKGRATATESERQKVELNLHNYPNPFSESTRIEYVLDRPARVTLRIYNALGQEVSTLVHAQWSRPGIYRHQWDGKNADGYRVRSGMYYYLLEINEQKVTGNMTLLR